MNGWWYLHSGEGTASNEVLQSRKGPPAFFTLWCSRAPEYFHFALRSVRRTGRSPCYSHAAPTPPGHLQTVPDACQISPPILPQFHRCIRGLGPTTSTSDHRLLDNAEILLICLQAASDSYLSYSYFTTPMPSLAKSCSQRPTAPTRPARLLGPFLASCLHLFRPQAPPLKSVLELNFYDIITLTASMAPRLTTFLL